MSSNRTVSCISFVDARHARVAARFQREASKFSFFDYVKIFSETDLDPGFVATLGPRLSPSVRGFGYWAWKPQVILQTMRAREDGDIILYADGGCRLNHRGVARLRFYIDKVAGSEVGVLGFQSRFPEKHWNKGDLLSLFGFYDSPAVLDSGQVIGGVVLIKVCEGSRQLVNDWRRTFMEDFSRIDDSQSLVPNHSGFRGHRHDQSIFSLLAKSRGAVLLSASEELEQSRFSSLREPFPIHARRDWPGHASRKLRVRLRVVRGRVDLQIAMWRRQISKWQ